MIGTAIQQKYVYLFELDSVRDSDEEIIAGQAAIYDEIVRKGNTVVLTYNQLVDSRAFFSLMTDEAYYRNILQLFEQGCIRISQFGDIRTVAQYILSTVDANKKFIYSALPLKFTQKRLIALVQRSLVYSDLSEIREYMEGGRRSDEDVEDLFIELERDDAGNVKRISMDGDGEDVAVHRDILKNLYSFLSIILRLSMLHDVYIAPRKASEFAPSDEIPIADTGDRAVVRKLVRSMELYHQEFGMVYQSRYNTFLVDPIAKADGTYYPFERVLPTAGNGVVIAAMRAEKFILLKQYRHALRAEQYSFPRGYAEPGTAPLENIRRELAEELHATVMHAPQSLGFLEPDSGLTSRRIEVFLVELDDYQANIGHEGIIEVREVSPEDLAQMIENGTVSDGYTIGAMELWQLKNAS